jgi:hypothetical protein
VPQTGLEPVTQEFSVLCSTIGATAAINMYMKYFQYLDLDWEPVSKKLKQFVLENKEYYKTPGWKNIDVCKIIDVYPDIIRMLKPLNVLPINASLFISHSAKSGIHKDNTTHNSRRILIPIMNCEHSFTRFYTTEQDFTLKVNDNGVPYYGNINPDLCTFVEEFRLDRAVAIRPKEPHNVVSDELFLPRISCPININKDLDYLFD